MSHLRGSEDVAKHSTMHRTALYIKEISIPIVPRLIKFDLDVKTNVSNFFCMTC